MFIDYVEIENFKSFNGLRRIGPFDTLNSIVGPNGSGKSNILDAILFCFGDTSRRLRVERLSDLIHAPPWLETRPTFCSVKITVKLPKLDDTKTFSRRVNINGTEAFAYNGESVPKKEYLAIVEKFGLFTRFDNCAIRQGSIELMLTNNGENRIKLLNAISGSDKLSDEYAKLENDIKEGEETLAAYRKDLSRNRKENRRLTDAKLKREEIDAEKAKLKEARVNCYLLEAYPLVQAREKAIENFENQQQQLTTEGDKDAMAADYEEKKALAAAKSTEVKKLRARTTKAESELKAAVNTTSDLEQSVAHAQNKVSTAQKMYKAGQKKAKDREADVAAIEANIRELEAKATELETQTLNETQQSLSQDTLNQYNELLARVENSPAVEEVSTAKSLLDAFKYQLASLNNSISVLENKLQSERRVFENLTTSDADEKRYNEMKAEVQELEGEIASIKTNKIKHHKLVEKLKQLSIQYCDAVRAVEHQREKQSMNAVEEDLLQRFKDRVFGRFRKLLTVNDPKYMMAVSRGCFTLKDAFVVDTFETASECIAYLRENKHPAQTFLAADSLTPKKAMDLPAGMHGTAFLRDVIVPRGDTGQDAVSTVIKFICGNVVVCDSSEDAKALTYPDKKSGRKGVSTVTLDGMLLKPGGVITGGVQNTGRDNFSEEDIATLRAKRETTLQAVRQLEAAIQGETLKMAKIDMLKTAMQKLNESRGALSEKKQKRVDDMKVAIDILETTYAAKKAEVEDVNRRIAEAEAALKTAEAAKKRFHDETFAEFCAANNITDFERFQKNDIGIHETLLKEKQELTAQIEKLKSEVTYLRSNVSGTSTAAQETYKKAVDDLAAIEKKLADSRPVLEHLQSVYDALAAELADAEKILSELMESADTAKKALRQHSNHQSRKAQLTAEHQETISQILHKLKNLFIECNTNGLELPLVNCEFANVDFFDSSAEAASESPRKVPVADVEIDFSGVQPWIRSEKSRITRLKTLQKEIEKSEQELRLMAAGVITVEDYNQRLAAANELNDAQSAKYFEVMTYLTETRKKKFALGKKRRDLFTKTFRHFYRKLSCAYKTLYRSNNAQAFLDLDNEDEPYKSRIRFECIVPGKNRRAFENLSGGEQSMAHLAFMIAARSKHVQFIVLDEFDAALDRRNIVLAKQYLRELAMEGHQIIAVSHRQEIYADGIFLFGAYHHCLQQCQLGTTVIKLNMEAASIGTSKDEKKRLQQAHLVEVNRVKPVYNADSDTHDVDDDVVYDFIGNTHELADFVQRCHDHDEGRCNNSAALASITALLEKMQV
uniref:Structural maintenance of chromosomes protein n=1 Tax=Panagrellus redivivus TaxID=6233 RepID=A0A7E4V1Y3_PANRE